MTDPRDLLDFTGRVVLVTGGARGVGRGIAERFLATGAEVAVAVPEDADEWPAGVGRGPLVLTADLTDAAQLDTLVAAVLDRSGRLDVVVNAAGDDPGVDAATASPERSTALIERDLLVGVHVSQRANAAMQRQAEGGAIVHVASLSALRPRPGTALYGAASAGLIGLTRSLAVEWAPKVRLNCVSVGPQGAAGGDDPAGVPPVPLGRLATATDIADACLYLASPLSAYVTGTNLMLHGGGEWPPFLAAAEPAT